MPVKMTHIHQEPNTSGRNVSLVLYVCIQQSYTCLPGSALINCSLSQVTYEVTCISISGHFLIKSSNHDKCFTLNLSTISLANIKNYQNSSLTQICL